MRKIHAFNYHETNTINAVILHCEQEARGELRPVGARVVQRWRCVGEPALRHEIVRLRGYGQAIRLVAGNELRLVDPNKTGRKKPIRVPRKRHRDQRRGCREKLASASAAGVRQSCR